MGIFDRLRGKREDAAAEVSSAEAAAQVSPSLDLTEGPAAGPGASARQQTFQKTFGVAPSDQLYNPYEGERMRPPARPGTANPTLAAMLGSISMPARYRRGPLAGYRPCRRRRRRRQLHCAVLRPPACS